ncbi:SusD/RagB family nutrient-binding outer membrane lipoprotein [Fulvivirgaceae bacterium PWU5]|uniref:SusD/RagB family nutrient-binding outer membrane lipoprotein n=2 Tax=Dawidia cretensis TaxID=2782350 RepID=A0AAP2DTW1_9BACT|nr:SusD/RagB family nutrient-binding outer membrane lipoprotein [Dawidia cretensis]
MRKYIILLVSVTILGFGGCDNGFEEMNKNPYGVTKISPALLFANAVRTTHTGSWEGEQTIVQQFLNAYDLGATSGFNFNLDNNNFNNLKWNANYENTIKLLVQAIALAKEEPQANVNLMSMMRIWKAHVFMTLVDTYGDVPYYAAGGAYIEQNFFPVYDDDEEIYEDLYRELTAASIALDPAGSYVPEDLLYGFSSATPAVTADVQAGKWKKLANSLLLRLGMRYSKINPGKGKDIVAEAVNTGVMETNADNAYLRFTTVYPNQLNQGPRTINPRYYYLAEPFVDQLKATDDPRAKYIWGKYSEPNDAPNAIPDVSPANQVGFPVGYNQNTITEHPDYQGTAGQGFNYSQLNFSVVGSAIAPILFVTNAQTKLLMAEAAHLGWIDGSAQQYYDEGVRASMDEWSLYPNTPDVAITPEEQDDYLSLPEVAFNTNDALELINTQYWIANVANGAEAFANFRRSGFPTLTPNAANGGLGGDGFARRMAYPDDESSENETSYQDAALAIGGDNLTTRVFWDNP